MNILHHLKLVVILTLLLLASGCASNEPNIKNIYTEGGEDIFLSKITKLELFPYSMLIYGSKKECGIDLPSRLGMWADEKIYENLKEIYLSHAVIPITRIDGYPVVSEFINAIEESGECVVEVTLTLLPHHNNFKQILKLTAKSDKYTYTKPFLFADNQNPSTYITYVGQARKRAAEMLLNEIVMKRELEPRQ